LRSKVEDDIEQEENGAKCSCCHHHDSDTD
jgi:hypothetical protein